MGDIMDTEKRRKLQIPRQKGLYYVLDSDKIIYIGSTINYRHRFGDHATGTNYKKLRDYFNSCLPDSQNWIIYLEPKNLPIKQIRKLENEAIAKLEPILNISGNPKKSFFYQQILASL